MAAQSEERGNAYDEDQDYTQDGTVDLKGRPVLRSKTGRWKACSFIIGYEMVERIAFLGIQANLVLYLTRELHQGTVTSSNNVTNWAGTVLMTQILGAYIADAYLGRFRTFLMSSSIYLLGMVLLTLSVSVPSFKPPPCAHGVLNKERDCPKASSFQVGIFYLALYIIAVACGGTRPNISTMGADQFDDFAPMERTQKLSFFNWWTSTILVAVLFSTTFLVYLQDNVGWGLGYGLPTAGVVISLVVFLVGAPFYRHKLPLGSPFTKMAKVFVAAFRKWNVPLPDDPKELYELRLEEYANNGKRRIDHTPSLRFLDKAAVNVGSSSPWMLSPVTHVEETKQITKMIPILVASIIPNLMIAQVVTLFIKQGTTLDRSIGPHFNIPPASLSVFVTLFMLVSLVIYDRLVVPILRRRTKNPRGVSLLQRLGFGVFLHVIVMITASVAEKRRLHVAKASGALSGNDTVPLSIFTLLPQFALMGVADSFLEASQIEFFYDQAPEGMKSLGSSFFSTSRGIGFFLSTFVLTTVSEITKRNGHKGWVLDNLNVSRLDHYYAFLALLAFINFVFFVAVSKLFVYNAEVKRTSQADLGAPDTLPY